MTKLPPKNILLKSHLCPCTGRTVDGRVMTGVLYIVNTRAYILHNNPQNDGSDPNDGAWRDETKRKFRYSWAIMVYGDYADIDSLVIQENVEGSDRPNYFDVISHFIT